MTLRRVISVLSVCVVATGTIVAAAPAKKDAKKGPVAPAKDPAPAPAPATGSGSAAAAGSGSGSAVQMQEDAPPSDMNGVDENPDAPRGMSADTKVETAAPPAARPAGYPIEEALRPITLPQNMSEVSIGPHARIGDGGAVKYAGGDALRARYGITSQVQLGLTYVEGGMYDDPNTVGKDYAFHAGKAVGLDVTVLLQNWIAVRIGVPVYVQPVAYSLVLGAPMKFQLTEQVAVGGMDDFLTIRLKRFAPSFYQEEANAIAAYYDTTNTQQSKGHIRFSGYGVYQKDPNLALLGRFGVDQDLGGSAGSMAGTSMSGSTVTFLRAGVQYTPRKYLDVGGSIGFDDLAHLGSFGPALYLALRI